MASEARVYVNDLWGLGDCSEGKEVWSSEARVVCKGFMLSWGVGDRRSLKKNKKRPRGRR